jgi:long-chain fatty acid transport protein
MKRCRSLISHAVVAALAAYAGGAQAAGFALIEQNASGLGNAYSGQAAAAENASTIFFNPAGMTLLPGKLISGAVHAIGPSIKFTDNGGSRSAAGDPQPVGGTNGGDAGDWAITGNAYLSWQLSPQLWAGVGFSVPFGLKTEYDPAFIGRFQSQLAEIKTYDLNPSIAYKVSDTVSVGGGISYQRAEVTLNRSFFPGAGELPQTVELDDDAVGFNLGAMFTVSPQTRIGVSYRSAMKYDLTGRVNVTGAGSASASAPVKLPDTYSVGILHLLSDKWQLLGDVTYTRWSTIQNVPLVLTSAGLGAFPAGTTADTLDFQFRNTYRMGVGANYRWSQQLMWKLGTAYDKSPVPDAQHRTAFLPDNDRWWVAVGGKYQASKATTIDFGYGHLFVKDADTLRNKAAEGQGVLSGSYRGYVNILSFQVSHSF